MLRLRIETHGEWIEKSIKTLRQSSTSVNSYVAQVKAMDYIDSKI